MLKGTGRGLGDGRPQRAMIEFTYDGIIRQGFGFYNPNHAAALICLLLPLVWYLTIKTKSIYREVFGIMLCIALSIALALTFSRTGFVVFFLQVMFFVTLVCISPVIAKRQKYHIMATCAIIAATFLSTAALGGLFLRVSDGIGASDAAFTNRLIIWKGGLELFANNPLGVGLENSGVILSNFIVPEKSGIVCNTLVNSWLTGLVELGVPCTVPLLSLILFSLISGFAAWKRNHKIKALAMLSALIGACLSGFMSTCFNINLLFDFVNFGGLPTLNFILSWILFFLFIFIIASLAIPHLRNLKYWIVATLLALVTLCTCLGFGIIFSSNQPVSVFSKDRSVFVCYGNKNSKPTLALLDDHWPLADGVSFLKKHYENRQVIIPLNSWQLKRAFPAVSYEETVLFGFCGDFSKQTEKPTILVSPHESIRLGKNIRKIYIEQFSNNDIVEIAEESSIPTEFF